MITASGVMWHALVPTKFKSLDLCFHPQVVDQFVYYCYLADYQFDQDNEAPEIHFATSFPPDKDINSFSYRKSAVDFHLEMYELAEHVESEFLKETVHQKLSVVILARQKYTALELGMLVEIFFAAVDAARLQDDDRRIENIFVTAVLINERVRWNRDDSKVFWNMIGGYRREFVEAYREAEKANRDLLGSRR
ncbi:erv26 super protein [Neocucurbitaria cava]|uniref:Erv26 super protein n=1 Tax=Neocucurbitaria cava TaxID=798079 RepID=A0A9W8YA46_9PLEO|nr:erv26 super protein [Neocucurbitaria cava]